MKFATKPYDTAQVTLGVLLHYLGKLNAMLIVDKVTESLKVGTFFETQCT